MSYVTDGAQDVMIQKKCRNCQKMHTAFVTSAEMDDYENGMMAQEAFKMMSAPDRELFFISGICGICWNEIFSF